MFAQSSGNRRGPPVHVAVAVGPAADDRALRRTLCERGLSVPTEIAPFEGAFFVFAPREPKERFLALNGRSKFICSAAELPFWREIAAAIAGGLSARVCGDTLDLSQLAECVDFDAPHNASFALFAAAILCRQRGIAVARVRFLNSLARPSAHAFRYARSYFPGLRALCVDRGADTSEIADVLAVQGVRLEASDCADFVQRLAAAPAAPACADPAVLAAFDEFPAAALDGRLYALSEFVAAFLRQSWDGVGQLAAFYCASSVFSVVAEAHGPHSRLEYFDRFAHNCARARCDNQLIGGDTIAQGQTELFDGHFFAKPSSYQVRELTREMDAVLIEGVFLFRGCIFRFARTIVLRKSGGGVQITNDNVFVRDCV